MAVDGALSWGKVCEEIVELSWLWMGPYCDVKMCEEIVELS